MNTPPLTLLAQQAVQRVLRPGDRAVDATLGNGHDTLFMARQVIPGGRVIGFDVQATALEQTRRRLAEANMDGAVDLLLCGHEHMRERVPPDWPGTVAAVMFNLGYLPGGDKSLTTHIASTLTALDQAVALLRDGGLISLLVYRGHRGGADEAAAVADWIAARDSGFAVTGHESPGPLLYLIERAAPAPFSRRGAAGN